MGEKENYAEGGVIFTDGHPIESLETLPEIEPAEQWAEEAEPIVPKIEQDGMELIIPLEILYAVNDNPKWKHLHIHAKKFRTRNKYRNKLARLMLERLCEIIKQPHKRIRSKT